MGLREQLESDMKDAMKSRDAVRLETERVDQRRHRAIRRNGTRLAVDEQIDKRGVWLFEHGSRQPRLSESYSRC